MILCWNIFVSSSENNRWTNSFHTVSFVLEDFINVFTLVLHAVSDHCRLFLFFWYVCAYVWFKILSLSVYFLKKKNNSNSNSEGKLSLSLPCSSSLPTPSSHIVFKWRLLLASNVEKKNWDGYRNRRMRALFKKKSCLPGFSHSKVNSNQSETFLCLNHWYDCDLQIFLLIK